jgi:translation elongation factor EF-1alpha
MADRKLVGKVTHFFSKISVAGIQLSDTLQVGDRISIEGATTKFEETIDSMQIENAKVQEAKPGDIIGIKVKDKTRVGDDVYLVGD